MCLSWEKKTKPDPNAEDLAVVESQLYKQKALNKQLENRLNQARDELERARTEVPAPIEEPKSSKKEMAEIERQKLTLGASDLLKVALREQYAIE